MASGATARASSGMISGVGFASAKMIGRWSSSAPCSGFRTPGPDRPKKQIGTVDHIDQCAQIASFGQMPASGGSCPLRGLHKPGRECHTARRFRAFTPSFSSMFRQAIPAAPPPVLTILMSSKFLPPHAARWSPRRPQQWLCRAGRHEIQGCSCARGRFSPR